MQPVRIIVLLAMLTGGLTAGLPAAEAPLRVAVSVLPHAWLVEEVGGDGVEVLTLVTPGQSPETYQPSDAQVSRVLRAGVLFRAGVPMEQGSWFQALTASGRVKVVDLRQGVPLRRMAAHGGVEAHTAGGEDPHIWLSPRLLMIQARTVAATLAELDPAHRRRYEANRDRLEAELAELDRLLREELRSLAGTAFFVFHPAWGYFADEYGLTQVAIESEGKEPADQELTRLQRRARELGIRVIFVQPQIPGKSAQAVARAVGARLERLDPLARDVPANLRAAARRLVAARAEEGA